MDGLQDDGNDHAEGVVPYCDGLSYGCTVQPRKITMDLTGSFNNLNQLTSRNWSGELDVWGSVT